MTPNYGQQQQRQLERDHKAAMARLTNPDRWWPDPSLPVEETVETIVDDGWQISQRVVRYVVSREIVEFAVTYSIATGDGKFEEVVSIDTCNHEAVHRHRNGDHSTREDIQFIGTQQVIQDQYWDAVEEAYALAYGKG